MKYTHVISLIFGSVVSLVTLASAQVPQMINYQGRVAVGGVNFDGTGQFKFALVDAGTTTTPTTRNASGTAVVNSGFITGITVTDGGVGYNSNPAVTITGGGGNGATATAVVNGGVVTEFTITSPGSGYNSDPLVNVGGQDEWPTNYVTYWSNDGTSTAGSEPIGSVSLTVTKGLYSVLLGANMTPIPNTVFANPDVHLRVWFDDGTNGSQLLTPDQRIAAVGYAMVASTVPDGAITSDKLSSGLTLKGTTNGTFSGDGSGLTNIPASAIVPADPPASPAGMVLIPAGDFAMGRQSGSGQGDELPVHTVTVSAFYLDQFEVTKALWDEVKTYADAYGYTFSNSGSGVGDHPVNRVNWYDCVKWCNARSEKEGLAPVYYTDAGFTTVYKTGEGTPPFANWTANGFRLPTEAEWEKAARGTLVGNTYPWGNEITGSDANYNGSGDPFDIGGNETTPVGFYDGGQIPVGVNRANGYGLYDMAGNVWEWCWDWYDENWYDNAGATTPDTRGPNTSPLGRRVLRGGSYYDDSNYLRCAYRGSDNPVNGNIFFEGFRSARGL